jgi:uncharacterized coiled-coil DUF342 family protein
MRTGKTTDRKRWAMESNEYSDILSAIVVLYAEMSALRQAVQELREDRDDYGMRKVDYDEFANELHSLLPELKGKCETLRKVCPKPFAGE